MENQEMKESTAGVFAIICSVLFPIIGIICYFVNKKEVINPSAYLKTAGIGFIIAFIIKVASGSFA